MKKNFSIVVPTQKHYLNNLECKVMNRIINLYSNKYDLYLIIPDDSPLHYENYGFQNIYLNKKNFLNIHSYNRLLLNYNFYKLFDNYDYILIHQLDAIILKDQLEHWCSKKYSYIGGPSYHKSLFKKKPITPKFFCNGGLSLRNINDFLKVLESKKIFFNKCDKYILREFFKTSYFIKYIKLFYNYYKFYNSFDVENFMNNFFLNEDVFWTIFAKLFYANFNLPLNVMDCANFSLSEGYQFYREKFNIQPFGIHGYKKENSDFFDALLI